MIKQKSIRMIISLILIIVFTFLTSCKDEGDYSIINGDDTEQNTIKYYICFKTEYMEALFNLGPDPFFDYDNPDEDIKKAQFINEVRYKVEFDEAKRYLSFDDDQKIRDYYKILIAKDDLKKSVPDVFKDIEHQIDLRIKDAYNKDIPLGIDDDSFIYISSIITNAAKKLNLTYEETIEFVYRPYLINDSILFFDQAHYLKKKYKGKKVEYNGRNDEEYEAYIFNLYKEYDEYLDKLLAESEILNAKE